MKITLQWFGKVPIKTQEYDRALIDGWILIPVEASYVRIKVDE